MAGRLKWVAVVACALALTVVPPVARADNKPAVPHTITWWCVDLNNLWNVDVTVIVGAGTITPPASPPFTPTCSTPYPVEVPEGAAFSPGYVPWYTNKTYTAEYRDALDVIGYRFHSNSPSEDFLSKLVEIRAEVRPYTSPGTVLATYRYDPRKVFKRVLVRDLFGPIIEWGGFGPVVAPDLGIDLSVEEVGRLPLVGFPIVVPGSPSLPPGDYRLWVTLVMSETHYDGICMDPGCRLPEGETIYVNPRFRVVAQ